MADALFDALPVLVWRSGTDRLCHYFNERWLEFTGRSLEQELGEGWSAAVHPDDLQRCLAIYNSAFDRREPFSMEYRLRHYSGEYRWVLDHGAPQFGEDGIFLGYLGGCTDIHDRKLVEQALRETEEQVRRSLEFNQLIMGNMVEGLYTLDAQGLVSYINSAAEQLFGWSSVELVGRKMHDMTHYRHPDGTPFPAEECAGLQVLRKGTSLSNHEDVFIRKDGTFFPVIYSSSPILSAGEIAGLVVVFRDVTAQKQAEQELLRSREQLRALAGRLQYVREEERTELACELHDQLNGTLIALKMDLSLLPDRAAQDRRLFLQKLSSMTELIDQTVARVSTIVTELRPVALEFGLTAAIEWQIAQFQERAGIHCETDLPSEEISLDQDRATAVFRIFQEALTNIARHAHASKVFVELKTEEKSIVLTVRDNGRGIDPAIARASTSVGLLGMRERALFFGGITEINASPNGGTLVRVKLPAG